METDLANNTPDLQDLGSPQGAAQLAGELIEALESGLGTLRAISSSLTHGFEAYTNLDLEGIVRLTADQQALCSDLRFFVRRWKQLSDAITENCADSQLPELLHQVDPRLYEHTLSLIGNVAEAQAEVRHLNRIHGQLIRRSDRLATIMQNVIAGTQGTYHRPSNSTPASGG
jgi:hypothetical protein